MRDTGHMNTIVPRGWCPSLFAPMRSGDGLLVRVKPPGGALTAAAARALASAAARFGNGVIELGNRASIQVRGLTEAGVTPFATEMVALGLACADPYAEARRTVIAAPLAGDDPAVSRHAASVAAAVAAMLVADARLAALPPKFGCLVDGGGVLPLGGVAADVRVALDGEDCRIGLDGSDLGAACAPWRAAAAVEALLQAFLLLSHQPEPERRMRQLVERVGADQVFAAAGLSPVPVRPLRTATAAAGWLPYAQGRGAFLAALPFGATDAATLAAVADLAERHADGLLRVSPFRAIAFCGVGASASVANDLEALGLITSPADPRARIAACPGRPACGSASVAARDDAAWLARLNLPGALHVSGCAKGCAQPAAADVVLVGEDGHYGLVRHGRAGDAPSVRGLTVAEAADLLRQHGVGEHSKGVPA